MAESSKSSESDEVDVGTQPAVFGIDFGVDSSSTLRPMATQAIFRPQLEEDSDPDTTDAATGEVEEHATTVARLLSRPDGWAAVWSRSRGCRRSTRSPH